MTKNTDDAERIDRLSDNIGALNKLMSEVLSILGQLNDRQAALEAAHPPGTHLAYLVWGPNERPWSSGICPVEHWGEVAAMHGGAARLCSPPVDSGEALRIASAFQQGFDANSGSA